MSGDSISQLRRELLRSIGMGMGISLVGGSATVEGNTSDEHETENKDSFDSHISDVLEQLDVAEKVSLLHQYQPSIPHADLESFRTGTEALHGVAWLGEATVFPQAIGLGSTWNPSLIKQIGDAVGDEVRGKHDASDGTVGLNVWSPTVDPLRDPRWGRNEEGYSEDPLLSSEIATAYTDGLTGNDPEIFKTAPVLKHFLGYNNEVNRTTTNAELPPKLLHDYYLQFFRPTIESGHAVGVMASYNLVNGRPMTVSPLLNRVREWAPEEQSILNVSDAWAPVNLTGEQEYFDSEKNARASALRAGLDSFTEYGADSSPTIDTIRKALDSGLLHEEDLDVAVEHILTIRSMLGEFLPASKDPYSDITADVIGRPEHRELARKAAREQIVLLKNDSDDPLLPLSEDETVAVLGPLSDRVFEDWYSGTPPYRITPKEGIRDQLGTDQIESAIGANRIVLRDQSSGDYVTGTVGTGGTLGLNSTDAPSVQLFESVQWTDSTWTLRATANGRYVTVEDEQLVNSAERPSGWEVVQEAFEFVELGDNSTVLHHPGSDRYVAIEDRTLRVTANEKADAARFDVEIRTDGIEEAVETATEADVAVIFVGTHPLMGGRETQDRETLTIAPAQRNLVESVVASQPRTVLVLESSYPVHVDGAEDQIPSILWSSHAGQETGRALADILDGTVSPGGRLTQTWPRSVNQLPDIREYNIAETEMTYRYDQKNPRYAFGHGLSYGTFEYSDLRVSPRGTLKAGDTVSISVRVTNTGSMAADEVVQCYTKQHRSRTKQPHRILRGFERIHLDPGERETVSFRIDHEAFGFWDITQRKAVVERTTHSIFVGSASDDIRKRNAVRVDGERIPKRDLSKETRAVDADDWSWSTIELLDHSRTEGTVVGMADGSWISFADVDLRRHSSEAIVSIAKAKGDTSTIELRMGSPSGRMLGRTSISPTGDIYTYEDIMVALNRANGNNQELYIVVHGGKIRMHTVQLE
ncbi:glycoside hydrolase family 3 C-terminal domain-containing protein [Halocatena halophila]|uniref:glycoside hydrolase family 3 C-terminal domain-containing protein n=1 Tax=Halocatena halophila TaxID=2814576 RepID=UPI002ED3CDA5